MSRFAADPRNFSTGDDRAQEPGRRADVECRDGCSDERGVARNGEAGLSVGHGQHVAPSESCGVRERQVLETSARCRSIGMAISAPEAGLSFMFVLPIARLVHARPRDGGALRSRRSNRTVCSLTAGRINDNSISRAACPGRTPCRSCARAAGRSRRPSPTTRTDTANTARSGCTAPRRASPPRSPDWQASPRAPPSPRTTCRPTHPSCWAPSAAITPAPLLAVGVWPTARSGLG